MGLFSGDGADIIYFYTHFISGDECKQRAPSITQSSMEAANQLGMSNQGQLSPYIRHFCSIQINTKGWVCVSELSHCLVSHRYWMFICRGWDEGSFVQMGAKMTLDLCLVAFAGWADSTRGVGRKELLFSHFTGEEWRCEETRLSGSVWRTERWLLCSSHSCVFPKRSTPQKFSEQLGYAAVSSPPPQNEWD